MRWSLLDVEIRNNIINSAVLRAHYPLRYTDLVEWKWWILQNNEGEQSDKVCETAVLRHFGFPVSRKERRWWLDEKQTADTAAKYLKRNYGTFLHIRPLISQMNPHQNGVISTQWSVFINLDTSVRPNQRGWKERGGEGMLDHTCTDLVYKKQTKVKGFMVK